MTNTSLNLIKSLSPLIDFVFRTFQLINKIIDDLKLDGDENLRESIRNQFYTKLQNDLNKQIDKLFIELDIGGD